ncbi:hypothetical protein QEZ52_00255 [Aliisedimentitalea scapharcae]|uniref:Uncharacterized protein n=1 Tax=Aliisedimentitalea scapharcae TaxID=1524259 RepID=A0ABZ2XSD6_9RHOB
MFRFLGALCGLVLVPVAPVFGEDMELKLKFSERYLACARENLGDDPARLACFDELMRDLPKWLEEGFVPVASCEIEDWKMQLRGNLPYMTGATTCPSGRLTYRMYDGETGEFVTSGFTYFEGYAFRDYPDTEAWPNSVDLKYTISDR